MKANISFEEIADEILKNRRFQKIATESHHGITRMEHSMRVAKYTYKIAKKLNIDYVSATRAAILHDFFTVEEFGNVKGLAKGILHPDIALANSRLEFDINDIEANAIEAHMFPLSLTLPRYKESWLITLIDKGVAIFEMSSYKFTYRKLSGIISSSFCLTGLFIFNVLTMGRK